MNVDGCGDWGARRVAAAELASQFDIAIVGLPPTVTVIIKNYTANALSKQLIFMDPTLHDSPSDSAAKRSCAKHIKSYSDIKMMKRVALAVRRALLAQQ